MQLKNQERKFLIFQCFVIPSGFEPETHSLEGCCSIQLSYGTPFFKVDAKVLLFFGIIVFLQIKNYLCKDIPSTISL